MLTRFGDVCLSSLWGSLPVYSNRYRLLTVYLVIGLMFLIPTLVAAHPAVQFAVGYLGTRVADKVFDRATGKPDLEELAARLKTLESTAVLGAEFQAEIRNLRLRIDETVTRDEFLRMVKELEVELLAIQSRLDSLEERVEEMEVQISDSKNHSTNATSSNFFLNRANGFFANGNHHRAIANCNIAIRLNPRNATAYFRRGQSYWNLDAPPDLVMLDHSEAIRFDENLTDAYYCRSLQWLRKNSVEESVNDVTKAIELSPNDAEFYSHRGYCFLRTGRFSDAQQDYTNAIQINPNAASNFAFRAWAYARTGDLLSANSDCATAVALDKSNAMVYLARCQVHLCQENYSSVIIDATECLRLQPKCGDALSVRGYANAKLGKWQLAKDDFLKVSELNPSDLVSTRNYDLLRTKFTTPDFTKGELLLDGEWSLDGYANGKQYIFSMVATVKDGELRIQDDKGYWKEIKPLANGRYSATRVIPGVFSPWEHNVELTIARDGTMRQDDSQLPPIHRTLKSLVFTPKDLKFEWAFKSSHQVDIEQVPQASHTP